jgi:hypothetical protein
MGVAHRRGKRRTQEKTGMGTAFEKANGSHKVWGIFARLKTVQREDFSVFPRGRRMIKE